LKALTEDQLWERIHGLQGQVVLTPDQGRPNRVTTVSEDLVQIEDRKANPSRHYLTWCYRLVVQNGILTKQNLPEEFFNHRIARICMALIAAAVPEQIQIFHREGEPVPGLSGIEVYNKDC
jgi:hypothetical protein